MFGLFYFIFLNLAQAEIGDMIKYFREKPAELMRLEYFSQITKPVYSSQKSFQSSMQAPINTNVELKQKSLNDLGQSKTNTLGSRTLKENSMSVSTSYSMEKHGVLNSLTPSLFLQKQTSEISVPTSPTNLKTFETEATVLGAKIEYDILKNGLTSNGYLQNSRLKSQYYGQYASSLESLNSTYKQVQQNLLNLFSLQCRLQFADSNQIKLEEAQKKIDLAFKINMVTYSHVLNINEQLNSNEAQKQSLANDLNRLQNYFNSISPELGEKLLREIETNFRCEFDRDFVEKINRDYVTEKIQSNKDSFKKNAQYHSNLSSLEVAEANYKIIKNKLLPDVKPYFQLTQGQINNRVSGLQYDDKTVEVGLTLRLGLDPTTIRDEIMAQVYNREAAITKINYSNKVFNAEISRIIKSLELRKKLIISAQRALEASDKQIKYNESQKGVKNIDTLTMINGFRTRIQSVGTLVDAFVSLEQDYIEYKTYSDWKYVESILK
jgi:outer membrane protein TolC